MRKAAAAKRGAKETASRARQTSRKAKALESVDPALDNRDPATIAATAGAKPRNRQDRDLQGTQNWQAQPGQKVLVTTMDGQVHEATIVTEVRRAVVAELRDDQGTRVLASFSEKGGALTWRSDDGSVSAPTAAGPVPAPTVNNTRIGRERDRNRLSQADWVMRQQMGLAKLAAKEEPLYTDSPIDGPELKDFPLDTATPKSDAQNKTDAKAGKADDGHPTAADDAEVKAEASRLVV